MLRAPWFPVPFSVYPSPVNQVVLLTCCEALALAMLACDFTWYWLLLVVSGSPLYNCCMGTENRPSLSTPVFLEPSLL